MITNIEKNNVPIKLNYQYRPIIREVLKLKLNNAFHLKVEGNKQ